MQPHAEHQEHDADFGELLEHALVDRRQSRKEAHGETGTDVAAERGRFQKALEKVAERQREAEARDKARDEGVALSHGID